MLILTRHVDEEIVIGTNLIRVMVVEILGNKVKLGVSAPRNMSVHRAEVYERMQRDAKAEEREND